MEALILIASMPLFPTEAVMQRVLCFPTADLLASYRADGLMPAFMGVSPKGDQFMLWLSAEGDDFVMTVSPADSDVTCPIGGGMKQ